MIILNEHRNYGKRNLATDRLLDSFIYKEFLPKATMMLIDGCFNKMFESK